MAGSENQQWHIDSPHEAATHQPAHAVNVLVALADVPLEAGPTQFARGSHVRTNHLRTPWLRRDDLLYQSAAEVTPDALGVACHPAEALRAGDCLLFDDRVLHRGLANGRATSDGLPTLAIGASVTWRSLTRRTLRRAGRCLGTVAALVDSASE